MTNQHRRPAASLALRRDDSHARAAAARAQGAQAVQDDSHDDSILNLKPQTTKQS